MINLVWRCEPSENYGLQEGGFVMLVDPLAIRVPYSYLIVKQMRPETLWTLVLHDAERIVRDSLKTS